MAKKAPLKALIADDHGLYRMGLSLLLRDRVGVSEVIEVGSFDDALDCLSSQSDIVLALFDLSMPGMGGPESLRVVKETYPRAKVAVVSASEDRDHVLGAVAVGLAGFVPKNLSEDEITKALEQILDGRIFVPAFMAMPAPRAAKADSKPDESVNLEALTPRQHDVLRCVLKGLANKEIARELGIAEGTVKIHLAALFSLFRARNRTELATRAQILQHQMSGAAPAT